jgi:hypothetical protein
MSSATGVSGIVAVLDGATNRDLLLDPQPFTFAGSGTATLRVQNGPGGPTSLRITSDKPWLQSDQDTLDLDAEGIAELHIVVRAEGTDEFAILNLGWQEAGEDLAEHVLIRRQLPSPKPAMPVKPPVAAPSQAKPPQGTTELPDWMQT